MPVEMEHRLPTTAADIDDHAVIHEPRVGGGFGDEAEHPRGLVVRELGDIAQGVDVACRQDEQVRLGFRVDVADRYETVRRVDVVAVADELAEKTVRLRQRESPPP